MSDITVVFSEIIDRLKALPQVRAIGRTGGRPLPQSPADGDVDVFLYCEGEVPLLEVRAAALAGIGGLESCRTQVFSGGNWGVGDLVIVGGVEVWLMYYTTQQALDEVETILAGKRPGREGNFYPIGRCAMLAGITVLFDANDFLEELKSKLSVYPQELRWKLTAHHIGALDDLEDFERAVARGDVMFYHFAQEGVLDHWLQALFALNGVYFPSRKRSLEHIAGFSLQPERCAERLMEVLRLSAMPETLSQAFALWLDMVRDLKALAAESGLLGGSMP